MEESIRSNSQEILSSMEVHNIRKEDIQIVNELRKEDMLHVYKQMVVMRHMDELMVKEYEEGSIRGFCHLSIGQEGIYAALEKVMVNDMVVSSYRCHGIAYVTGCSTAEIMGEVLGKQMGTCKGKGGSMHLYNNNFFGGHGIVGAQVPLGLGIAYALKYRSIVDGASECLNQVCYIFYGDGAANQGQVWESFNMAMIWKLPAVFVCENNRYGMWTPTENVSADTDFYLRGGRMTGIRIGGGDIFALMSALEHGRRHALEAGPIIIQIDTYRFCGHSTVDRTDFYRSSKEVEIEKENDCIERVKRRLLGFYSEEDLEGIRSSICKKVEHDLILAKSSKDTEEDELFKDVMV